MMPTGGVGIFRFGVVTHVYIFIAISTLFVVKVVLFIVAFILDILTLCVRDVFFLVILAYCFFRPFHLVITALGNISFSLFEFSDKCSLEFGFFSAVSSAVVLQISFGLVRWVFGWSILLRIPGIERVS
jgi:hypothetical protein